MDLERNTVCAVILLVWAALLLTLSTIAVGVKLLCFAGLAGLLLYHVRRMSLTYEVTVACLLASGFLYLSDPMVLAQSVLLVYALLILAGVCLFMSVELLFLFIVIVLAAAYSAFLTLAVASHTDTAFTSLFLLLLTSLWLVFLRPNARNELWT